MNLRLFAAGSLRISRQCFFLLLICIFLFACRSEKKEEDSRIAELQQSVKQLSEENRRLLQELQNLRQDLKKPPTQPATETTSQTAPAVHMTMEQMKAGVEPLLREVIDTVKKTAETPRSKKQYGMRIEYDLKNAVYGLVNNEEEGVPTAKVIVQYEKFLESGEDSRSIGTGSSSFLFVYRSDRWVLQNYE